MEDNKREPFFKIGDVLEVRNEEEAVYDRCLIVKSQTMLNDSEFEYRCLCYGRDISVLIWKTETILVNTARRIGHIDISLLVGGKDEKKKWEVTNKEVSIDAKCVDSKDRLREDAEELLEVLKNCIDPNYQCCDCPYNEDCDTGRESLMKEAIRVLSLFLEKRPVYEYGAESKLSGTIRYEKISKVTNSTEDTKEENEKLKKEIEAMKEALDRQKHDNDIWKQGWFECLKSVGYYLNS